MNKILAESPSQRQRADSPGVRIPPPLVFTGVTWALIVLPLALVYSQITIIREERYLERAFGAAYADYKARVRRWI